MISDVTSTPAVMDLSIGLGRYIGWTGKDALKSLLLKIHKKNKTFFQKFRSEQAEKRLMRLAAT